MLSKIVLNHITKLWEELDLRILNSIHLFFFTLSLKKKYQYYCLSNKILTKLTKKVEWGCQTKSYEFLLKLQKFVYV